MAMVKDIIQRLKDQIAHTDKYGEKTKGLYLKVFMFFTHVITSGV